MICYNCGCLLSEKDFCTGCGVEVGMFKKIMYTANRYYNDGLDKAKKKVKELIAPFDKLNIISEPSESSSSGREYRQV